MSESTLTVRALAEPDVAPARALLLIEWDRGNPYVQRTLDRLDASAAQEKSEFLGLSAAVGDEVVGVALFGIVPGTRGAAQLHGVLVRDDYRAQGVGGALVRSVMQLLVGTNARLMLAEVPDDPAILGDYWAFLAAMGFREESRVDDYVREGVAIAFLRRDISADQILSG